MIPTLVASLLIGLQVSWIPETADSSRSTNANQDSVVQVILDKIKQMIVDRVREKVVDCDENGYPDSLDIGEGFASDRNHNGVIDTAECESDSEFALAHIADLDLWVGHEPDETVRVQYLVPRSGSLVRIDVIRFDTNQRMRELVNCVQTQGEHDLTWDERDDHGNALREGSFKVRYRVGSHTLSQNVRWRSAPQ